MEGTQEDLLHFSTREKTISPRQRHNDLTDRKKTGNNDPIITSIIRYDSLIIIIIITIN